MTRNRRSRLAAVILTLALAAAPSCEALANYSDATTSAAPPAIGAGIGAAVGGPFGAAIGAGIGAIVSFFQHRVVDLKKENKDLREGIIYGRTTAHELFLPDALHVANEVLPWYFQPWLVARVLAGWALLLFVVSWLAWKYGHPVFGFLRGLLSFGAAPVLAMMKKTTQERAAVRKVTRQGIRSGAPFGGKE